MFQGMGPRQRTGFLCCRSVWVCKLLGLGPADLYQSSYKRTLHQRLAPHTPTRAWGDTENVSERFSICHWGEEPGQRPCSREGQRTRSPPQGGQSPPPVRRVWGQPEVRGDRSWGTAAAVPAQTRQTSLYSLTPALHMPASSLKPGACACLLQILHEQQPQLPLPWLGGAHGIAWHRVAWHGIAEPHQGLSQAAEAPQPVPALPAQRGDVGQLLQPPLAQRGRASARSTFGWVGRRGECSQHKHSIILPFFLLCLLC